MRINFKNNKKQGFTLIEVILSLLLAGIVFVTMYSLFAVTIKYDLESRYEIIASNLAQEGIEIIRNKRDENLMNELELNDGLSEGVCIPSFEGADDNEPVCDSSGNEDVYFDSSNNYYRNCSGCGDKTVFERECDIEESSETEIKISCTVSWESAALGIDRELTIKGYLSNWQE